MIIGLSCGSGICSNADFYPNVVGVCVFLIIWIWYFIRLDTPDNRRRLCLMIVFCLKMAREKKSQMKMQSCLVRTKRKLWAQCFRANNLAFNSPKWCVNGEFIVRPSSSLIYIRVICFPIYLCCSISTLKSIDMFILIRFYLLFASHWLLWWLHSTTKSLYGSQFKAILTEHMNKFSNES